MAGLSGLQIVFRIGKIIPTKIANKLTTKTKGGVDIYFRYYQEHRGTSLHNGKSSQGSYKSNFGNWEWIKNVDRAIEQTWDRK